MVPQDQVYDLRLQLSGEGLPGEADTGYALLDKQGITTSDFMQHVDYQRALEGELSKTIKSIDGVEAATVHLVIPQKDVFADDAGQDRPRRCWSPSQAGKPLDQPAGAGDRAPGRLQRRGPRPDAGHRGRRGRQGPVRPAAARPIAAGGDSGADSADRRRSRTG